MKIAYYISSRSTFPPDPNDVAASSTVVMSIIKHLREKHEITVYAPTGSRVEGVRIVDLQQPPFKIDSSMFDGDWTTKTVIGLKQLFLGALFEDAKKYDIIHLHTEPIHLAMPYISLIHTPVLFTMHNIFHPIEEPIFKYYDGKINLSALSKNQAKTIPFHTEIPIIYNGIEADDFPYTEKPEDYILFFGRLVKDKGIEVMLDIVKNDSGQNYIISGKGNADYAEQIKTLCSTKENLKYIEFIPVRSEAWFNMLAKAKCVLMPIQWEEPFGLVMIEAMACGTPIIAYGRGSVPEIVEDGKTGFIVNSSDTDIRGEWIVKKTGVEGIREAINRINAMTQEEYTAMRLQSRKHVETVFSAKNMASQYEQLYESIVNHNIKHIADY